MLGSETWVSWVRRNSIWTDLAKKYFIPEWPFTFFSSASPGIPFWNWRQRHLAERSSSPKITLVCPQVSFLRLGQLMEPCCAFIMFLRIFIQVSSMLFEHLWSVDERYKFWLGIGHKFVPYWGTHLEVGSTYNSLKRSITSLPTALYLVPKQSGNLLLAIKNASMSKKEKSY